jgi:Domain of unknown function (DUF4192)
MNVPPGQRLRISSPAGLLAVVPHLLGFTPENSLVVLGVAPPAGRVRFALRYDLPDPPDAATAAAIAAHAAGILARYHLTTAVVAGYGAGPLVTPAADAVRDMASRGGVALLDVLRVQDGRFWSYLCGEPSCCPAEGMPFDAAGHPASAVLADAGLPVLPGRDALAATIAPLTGPVAEAMAQATRRAERVAARITATAGPRALDGPGLAAVRTMVQAYRDGRTISSPVRHAWLALVLTQVRIRDDAWARMDPDHRDAHRRLWTDVVRRAQPGYVAAPASLLAFTAWQCGDGTLANIAIERALADTPGYSMALLLGEALDSGAPPSMATPPMTPDEVAASYADPSSGAGATGG